MKSVLISIKPKWCEKICNGEKTIEVRKSAPKEVPFKAYIYETKESKRRYLDDRFNSFFSDKSCYTDMGKVIGEFICRGIMQPFDSLRLMAKESCLTQEDLLTYSNGKPLYGWRIADLKIYDKPKELSEFYYYCKEMKANEPHSGKYVSLSCYACRHNALKRTEDYSEYNNMLGYICKRNITRPPQSWQYVEEVGE